MVDTNALRLACESDDLTYAMVYDAADEINRLRKALCEIYEGARSFYDMQIAHNALCKTRVEKPEFECESCRDKRYGAAR